MSQFIKAPVMRRRPGEEAIPGTETDEFGIAKQVAQSTFAGAFRQRSGQINAEEKKKKRGLLGKLAKAGMFGLVGLVGSKK